MHCLFCGTEIILEDNQMVSDVEGWEKGTYDEDTDAMITYAHCPKCQMNYEFTDASQSEIDAFDGTYVGSVKVYKNEEDEE